MQRVALGERVVIDGQSRLRPGASTAILQPSRSATSRRRCEFDEFGAPTTIKASTTGATFFTASWRLVVA